MANYFLTNIRNKSIMSMEKPHSRYQRRSISGKSNLQVLRMISGYLARQGAFAMTKPLLCSKPLTLTGGECL